MRYPADFGPSAPHEPTTNLTLPPLADHTHRVVPAFTLENVRPPVLQLPPVVGKDKYDHFIGSAFLTAAGYCLLRNRFEISHQNALVCSAGISLSFGIGKEVYDKLSRTGHPSWRDILADIAGVALGIGGYSFVN